VRGSGKRHQILPSDFFRQESEKTKFNWFFFEYAAEIQSRIGRPLKARLRREGIGEKEIAGFCIHYSKQTKRPILAKLSGKASRMVHSYHTIEKFFPTLDEKLVDELLTVVGDAWEGLLGMCERCPTRCISEKEKKATMFDNPLYYE